MLDADVVAVSPASVWPVLHRAGRLARWNHQVSKRERSLAARPLKAMFGEKRRSEFGPGVSPPGRIACHRDLRLPMELGGRDLRLSRLLRLFKRINARVPKTRDSRGAGDFST
jgi:hypothetical protein